MKKDKVYFNNTQKKILPSRNTYDQYFPKLILDFSLYMFATKIYSLVKSTGSMLIS